MAICYDRLFHLMIDKKISNAQLKEKAGFSANIITRLKRNEYIERLCRFPLLIIDDFGMERGTEYGLEHTNKF